MNGNSTEYAAGIPPLMWGFVALAMLVAVGFSIADRDWEEALDSLIIGGFAWIIGGYRQREVDAEKLRSNYPGEVR